MTTRTMLKSKIHRARVTDCNIDYEGSITIDPVLLEAADILPFERVEVVNINNGARFSTYVIEGHPNTGEICLNGAAARLASKDDIVIIITYHEVPSDQCRDLKPRIVHVDAQNHITSTQNVDTWMDDLISAK